MINETTWAAIEEASGAKGPLSEFTSVTQRLRRVGLFDAEIVLKAIQANAPTKIVLNHLDYVDWKVKSGLTRKGIEFLRAVELQIGQTVDWVGLGPDLFTNPETNIAALSAEWQ